MRLGQFCKMIFVGLLILVHITWIFARQPGCDERGPICGNDGKTYATMCQLIWARLEDSDLAVLHEGSCNGKYYPSISPPLATQGSDAEKVLKKLLQKKKLDKNNHAKIKEVMPVGWPPLGPIIVIPERPVINASGKLIKKNN